MSHNFSLSVAQQPKFGLGHHNVEVTRSYTDRHKRTHLTGDLLIAEATPYTIPPKKLTNKHASRIQTYDSINEAAADRNRFKP